MSFENSQVKCKLLVSFQSDMRNKDLMLTEATRLCQEDFSFFILPCADMLHLPSTGSPQGPGASICTPELKSDRAVSSRVAEQGLGGLSESDTILTKKW